MNRILDLFRKRRQPMSDAVRSMLAISLTVVGFLYTPIMVLFSFVVNGLTIYIIVGIVMLICGIWIGWPLFVAWVRRRKNSK